MKVGELYFSLGLQPDASWGKVRGMMSGMRSQMRGAGGGGGGLGGAAGGPMGGWAKWFGPASGRRNDKSNRSVDWASATGDPFSVGKPGGGGKGGGGAPGVTGFFKKLREGVNDLAIFRRALYGTFALQTVKTVADLADAYTNMHNRLVTLTGSQEEAEKQYQKGREVARDTRSDLEGTVEAYVRISNATKTLGLTSEQTWQFVTSVQEAMQMSGASAEEAKSGMTQFTQALAKGKLDGDEFRSIAENMPNILTIMGKALGKTEGQLRQMSKSGQLTREKIVESFTKMKDTIHGDFGKTVPTIAQQFQAFKNEMVDAVGKFAKNVQLVKLATIVFTALGVVLKGVLAVLTVLATIVNGAVDAFMYLWNAAKNGSDLALAALIGIGAAITAMIVPALIAMVATVVTVVIPALYAMAVAAWASAGPYALIVLAVAAIAYGIIKLVKHWDEVKAKLEEVWEATEEGFMAAFEAIAETPFVKQLIWLVNKLGELTGAKEWLLGKEGDEGTMGRMARQMKGDAEEQAHPGGPQYVQGPYGPQLINDPNATNSNTKNVTIGPTTVNINATDAADAKKKFEADSIDRMNRQTAAALVR